MRQVCTHEPDECDCELNRFTPAEFIEWLELEVERERGKPVRLQPAGRPNAPRLSDPRINLAAAG